MEVCADAKESLNHASMQLRMLSTVLYEGRNYVRANELMDRIMSDLDKAGEKILDIDDTIGKMSITLEELKEENEHIKTSAPAVSMTDEVTPSMMHGKLTRKHHMYSKKLAYYCHLYSVLKHQMEAQRLANEMRREGFESLEFMPSIEGEIGDYTGKREAMKIGPHFGKILQDFANTKK